MRRTLLPVLVVLLVTLAGCGDNDGTPAGTVTTTTAGNTDDVGTVTMVKSGGIDGSYSGVRVSRDGSLEVPADAQGGTWKPAGQVAPSTHADIRHAVGRGVFLALADDKQEPPDCADTFAYTVTAEVDDRTVEVNFDDCDRPPDALRRVIVLLEPLLETVE